MCFLAEQFALSVCDIRNKKHIHLCLLNDLSIKIRSLPDGKIVCSHDRVFVFRKRVQTIF